MISMMAIIIINMMMKSMKISFHFFKKVEWKHIKMNRTMGILKFHRYFFSASWNGDNLASFLAHYIKLLLLFFLMHCNSLTCNFFDEIFFYFIKNRWFHRTKELYTEKKNKKSFTSIEWFNNKGKVFFTGKYNSEKFLTLKHLSITSLVWMKIVINKNGINRKKNRRQFWFLWLPEKKFLYITNYSCISDYNDDRKNYN